MIRNKTFQYELLVCITLLKQSSVNIPKTVDRRIQTSFPTYVFIIVVRTVTMEIVQYRRYNHDSKRYTYPDLSQNKEKYNTIFKVFWYLIIAVTG